MIKSNSIRDFTEYCILRFPDYYWTLPASTSGHRHGGEGETLIDHIQACLYLAECVIEQFEKHWSQRQKDQLISAIMLHDGWRCGHPGQELRFTEEIVEKMGLPMEKIGMLKTHPEHPEFGYKQVLLLATEYNQKAANMISARDLGVISEAVRQHYGPFTQTPGIPFNLDMTYSNVIVQVHNIDYFQAKNSLYFRRIKNV